MRSYLFISLLFLQLGSYAQNDSILINRSKQLHLLLISKEKALANMLDEDLSYGHSNGMLETKREMLTHLQSGEMEYFGIKEDSIIASRDKNIGYVRYVANMEVGLNGKRMEFRLKVLEVWRMKNAVWKLYARQAVRAL